MNQLHLATGELMRALDDELTAAEAERVEGHLDACDPCRIKLRELGAAAACIETALLAPVSVAMADQNRRDNLVNALRFGEAAARRSAQLSRFWYSGVAGSALAAGLAIVLFTPRHLSVVQSPVASTISTLQVNGETFIQLPYSNGDLGAVAPRIVEMQLPASSLVNAGLVFEPISTTASEPDRSVRADVLLGADGEPLGVHVFK